MKVFVTGADGFIGSHLCEALRDRGDEVTGLAQYNSFDSFGWLDEVEGVERVVGDVRDPGQMRALIEGHDLVFHLAALGEVPYSYIAPRSFIDTNVMGTLNVLEACICACADIVHTSTSEVYGSVPDGAITEDFPMRPQSPYAASKVAADALVRSYNLTYGLPAVILRPFNTYGPRQSKRAVIPSIIHQTLDPSQKELGLGEIKAERDWTYVDDMVLAFLAVAELDDFDVYNAGSCTRDTVLRVVQFVERFTGIEKPIEFDEIRMRPKNSEVMGLQANVDLLRTATGWAPKVGLEQGLARTIEWHQARMK